MYSNLVKYVPNRKPPMGAVPNPYLPINRGLVFYPVMWEGAGDTVEDLSKNGNTGTRGGTGTIWVLGKYGSAQAFNGTDDIINFGMGLRPVKEFSFVTYIKVDVMPDAGTNLDGIANDTILSQYSKGWGLILYDANKIRFWVNTWNVNFADVTSFTDTTDWHCVIGVYDGTTIKIYLDNVVGSVTDTYSDVIDYSGATTGLQFGKGYTGNDNWFTGKMSHSLLYNRALSASERAELCLEPFCGFRWTNIIELASYVAVAPSGIPIFRRRRAG